MKKTFFRALFMGVAFFAMTSNAEDARQTQNPVPSNLEENVVVNSRPLSSQKKKLMEKKRRREYEEADKYSRDSEAELSSLIIPVEVEESSMDEKMEFASLIIPVEVEEASSVTNLASLIIPVEVEEFSSEDQIDLASLIIPIKDKDYTSLISDQMNQTAATLSHSAYHWIDFFPQDNILKTEDGAEWIFDKNSSHISRTWRAGDTLVITPKGRGFWSLFGGSNYSYVITNKDLGSSIDVNLFLGPIAFGTYSYWIVGIDYNLGQVYLMNGNGERSVWEISNVDLYLFKEWEVNDTLIIGYNDSWWWWFSSHDHIFINVNMNHYVRAKQISSNPAYHHQAEA